MSIEETEFIIINIPRGKTTGQYNSGLYQTFNKEISIIDKGLKCLLNKVLLIKKCFIKKLRRHK